MKRKKPDKEYRNRQKRKRAEAKRKWRKAYTAYLQSKEWKAKRAYILRRDKGECQVCGGKAEQVHHLTYVRVRPPNFSELMSDLIAVCVPCHEEIHS